MENLKKQCEEIGFNLSINEVGLTAMAVKINSKARFPKPEFNYRFRTKERMIEFVNEFIAKKLEFIKRKEERKAAIRKAKEQMNHSFEVGQILYDSWGWEQTNIDFYQVTAVLPKSIEVRRIASRYAKHQPTGNSPMSAYVVPVKNGFLVERKTERKPIQVLVNEKGEVKEYYIKSKHGWISKYTNGENGIYESWYA